MRRASLLAPLLFGMALLAPVAQAGSGSLPVPEGALAAGAWDGQEARLEARLLVHPDDDPAQGAVRVGVLFDLDPGWHIYAREPGDTGLPTQIAWTVEGGRAGPLAWPAPRTYRDGELASYGYEPQVLLVSDLHLEPVHGEIRARVEALACAEECIPATLELVRAIGAVDPAPAATLRELFGAAAAAVPAGPQAAQGPQSGLSLLALLAMALLGGVILNAMPCVLPVLAIKVFAIAELAHRERGEVIRHGLAYTAGVEASMAALAAVVIGLRGLGISLGWGFQFQEPLFLAAISAVVFLFALNLLGVFEIGFAPGRLAGVGATAVGPRRSFFEGLLAVILATPCSAPFLGTAVGFAFAGPPALIVAVFASIGLGLAAPFLIVSAVPGWARVVPRSGPWMLHVRSALGFALLATGIWLLWILGRAAGVEVLVRLLAALWLLGLAAWLFGRLQERGFPSAGRGVALSAAALLLLSANTVSVGEARPAEAGKSPTGETVYAREKVVEAVAEGRPVFAYFTADWCLTCKANERLVLRDPAVQQAFARRGVRIFRADWTRRDEAIRAELARFGRAGVPLYLLYPAHSDGAPVILPELLTSKRLIAALEKLDARDAQP